MGCLSQIVVNNAGLAESSISYLEDEGDSYIKMVGAGCLSNGS